MFTRKPALPGHPDLFVSAKTASPVRARHPALRVALVQSSLDPAVRSISHVPSAVVASAPVELDAVVLTRDDGRFHLDCVPARRLRELDEEGLFQLALRDLGLGTLTMTADDLRREPLRSNRDLVWSYNGRPVPIDLRVRILQILVDDGPMALDRLLRSVVSAHDPAAAVLALACANLLELDLTSGPIGLSTTVRSRT